MIGQAISHHRILARLGEGGTGAVYRAQDLTLGREVALRFLPPDTEGDPEARKRLFKEAQTASHLNHPSIATIYAPGTSEQNATVLQLLMKISPHVLRMASKA